MYIAGIAGSGKTTVGKIVSEKLGVPFHEVEARECWKYRNIVIRQKCFLEEFRSKMDKDNGIYSNHLLSVYGYSIALGLPGDVADSILVEEKKYRPVVLFVVSREELRRRILDRMTIDAERRMNWVESMIDVHMFAQEAMLKYAKINDIPIIDTSNKPVEAVVDELLSLIRNLDS